jgi:formate--tetrahydrofolate ligase
MMHTDIEIAQLTEMRRILDIATSRLGIPEDELEPFGHFKAKVSLSYLEKLKDQKNGKLILVTAISPTPAGEGKTTTTVGYLLWATIFTDQQNVAVLANKGS